MKKGEEVQNPKRTIPLAMLLTFIIVSIAYFGLSIVLTLMMPYCLIDLYNPIPVAFKYVGFGWATYVVTVGSLLAIFSWFFHFFNFS